MTLIFTPSELPSLPRKIPFGPGTIVVLLNWPPRTRKTTKAKYVAHPVGPITDMVDDTITMRISNRASVSTKISEVIPLCILDHDIITSSIEGARINLAECLVNDFRHYLSYKHLAEKHYIYSAPDLVEFYNLQFKEKMQVALDKLYTDECLVFQELWTNNKKGLAVRKGDFFNNDYLQQYYIQQHVTPYDFFLRYANQTPPLHSYFAHTNSWARRAVWNGYGSIQNTGWVEVYRDE